MDKRDAMGPIKSVLPCLVPKLHYSDLGEVQDGTQAQQAYFDLTRGALTVGEIEALRMDLLDYCRLDTYAMVARLCGDQLPGPM